MIQPTCQTCPYWDRVGDVAPPQGECRRHSPIPRIIVNPQEAVSWCYWPVTLDRDWCGEHPDFAEYLASRDSGEGMKDEG